MGLRAGTTVTFAGFNRRMRKTACPVVWEGAGSIPAPTRSAIETCSGRALSRPANLPSICADRAAQLQLIWRKKSIENVPGIPILISGLICLFLQLPGVDCPRSSIR